MEVAAANGDEAVQRLLGGRRRLVDGAGVAGIGVAQVLQGGAVGRVVVPDGELEQGGAQQQQQLGLVGFFDRRLPPSPHVSQHNTRHHQQHSQTNHGPPAATFRTEKYFRPPHSWPLRNSSSSWSSSSVSSWPTRKAGRDDARGPAKKLPRREVAVLRRPPAASRARCSCSWMIRSCARWLARVQSVAVGAAAAVANRVAVVEDIEGSLVGGCGR